MSQEESGRRREVELKIAGDARVEHDSEKFAMYLRNLFLFHPLTLTLTHTHTHAHSRSVTPTLFPSHGRTLCSHCTSGGGGGGHVFACV